MTTYKDNIRSVSVYLVDDRTALTILATLDNKNMAYIAEDLSDNSNYFTNDFNNAMKIGLDDCENKLKKLKHFIEYCNPKIDWDRFINHLLSDPKLQNIIKENSEE